MPHYNSARKRTKIPDDSGVPRPRQGYGHQELDGHIADPSEFADDFLDDLWLNRHKRNWLGYVGAREHDSQAVRIRVEGRRSPIDTAHTYPRGENVFDYSNHFKTTLVKWRPDEPWRVLEKDWCMHEYTWFHDPVDGEEHMLKETTVPISSSSFAYLLTRERASV